MINDDARRTDNDYYGPSGYFRRKRRLKILDKMAREKPPQRISDQGLYTLARDWGLSIHMIRPRPRR